MTYTAPVPFDYDALSAGLGAVIGLACNLPGSSCGTPQNADQSYYFPDNDPANGVTLSKITYDIRSVKALGVDEWRVGYDPSINPPGDTYVNPKTGLVDLGSAIYSSEGNRQILVSIKCECWDLMSAGAVKYIERIRARMTLPSFNQALNDLNCAWCNASNTRTMSYNDDDGRAVCVAQFDLTLNAADAAVDDPITSIEKLGKPTFTPVT